MSIDTRQSPSKSRRNLAALPDGLQLAGLVWLGYLLRVLRLGNKSVWWDEGLAAWAARQSLPAISAWTAHDVHPPLYFWQLHYWRLLSGDSEFGLRYLSALTGILTIPAVFLLARAVGGRRSGWLAAALMAVSHFDIAWSQEMRMYAQAALLAALALWAATRVWNWGRGTDWSLYVLFMAAGLYTLYLSVMVLVVANLAWLALVWPRRSDRLGELWRWMLAQAAVLLLFAPWLLYALGRIPSWTSASAVRFFDFLKIYWTVLTLGIQLRVEQFAWLTLPLLAIFGAGLAVLLWQARTHPRRQRDLAMLLLGLSLPAVIVYLVSLPKETFFYAPQIAPRYLIIFLAAYVTLFAWGLVRLSHGRHPLLASLLATAVLLGSAYGLRGYHRGRVLLDDYKSLAATLAAYERPSDAVVLYTDTDWPIFAYHHPAPWRGVPHHWQLSPPLAEQFLAPIWAAHDGVWLVVTPYASISDPQGHLVEWLAERAVAVDETRYGDKALFFYARTAERAAETGLVDGVQPRHRLDQPLGEAGRLEGYDQPVSVAHGGDTVHLFLYGSGQGEVTAEIGLVDGQGRRWSPVRVDLALAPPLRRWQIDLPVPPDAPDGHYAFYVAAGPEPPTHFGRLGVRAESAPVVSLADVTIPNRLDVDFADNIRLLGYEVETAVPQPGGVVNLTLYWQALGPVSQRYKVFTHLLGDVFNADSGNFLWGQQDNEPVNNSRPTGSWRTGEVIADRYAIPIADHAPDGRYQLEIGLYDPATGVRLLVEDETASDHLILIDIPIARP